MHRRLVADLLDFPRHRPLFFRVDVHCVQESAEKAGKEEEGLTSRPAFLTTARAVSAD